MCETHQALSSSSARREAPPQIPAAAKMQPPITSEGDYQPNFPEAAPAVAKAIAPPIPKEVKPADGEPVLNAQPKAARPQPKRAEAPAVPGEAIDPWAREAARDMSRTMQVGLSRKETQRIAQAVTEAVGTRAIVAAVKGQALQVIRAAISAIGTQRAEIERVESAPKTVAQPRPPRTLHASNQPGFVAKKRGGGSRPQYGQYARQPITVDEPTGPAPISATEMDRRKAALAAHLAAQKAAGNEDGE